MTNQMQPHAMPVWGASTRLVPIRKPAPRSSSLTPPSSRVFKMTVEGDCLRPLIADGTMLAFDKAARLRTMTIVAVCLAPAAMGTNWGHQWIVKRMVEPFPPRTRLGAQAATGRPQAAPKTIVEQTTRSGTTRSRADQVLAVVACVGTTEFGPKDWVAPNSDFALEGRRHD